MTDESVYDDDGPNDQAPVWRTLVGAAMLLALVAATALTIAQIYPSKLASPKSPSFVDNIVDAAEDLDHLKRRLVESDEALAEARSVVESLVRQIDTMESNS